MAIKRCDECKRPVCQRKLTLHGCKYRNAEEISIEKIDELSINPFEMHELFSGM